MSLSRADVQRYEGLIAGLRVNELQSVLVVFNLPKLGKKQDLIQRAYSLLHSPTSQGRLVTTLEEITRRSTPSRSAPYPQQLVQSRRNGYAVPPNLNPALAHVRPPAIQPRNVKSLRTMILPFYDLISTLVEPIELPAMVGPVKTSKQIISFGLSPSDMIEFKDKPMEKELPRYELQLRFFNVTGDYSAVEQPDSFPLNCFVRLDDQIVVLPNVIPTNKPNAEPVRPSRPVNITPYCCPPRPVHMPHSLSVEWSADRRAWACGLYKVRRVTSKILYDRANSNHSARLTNDITRQTIIRRLSGDDDGICLSQIKVSLLCPLGKIRMALPARGKDCTHLQCFDLKLFLEMNEKRPTWKCAVCSGTCHYNNLIIDGYFEDILNSVSHNVTEVELLRDGGYRTIHEEDASSSDDNADDIVPVDGPSTSSLTNLKPVVTNQPVVAMKAKPEDDIITLSDSDDDDDLAVQRAVENSVSYTRGTPIEQPHLQPTCPSSPCSSDNSVIILDDTPPRPSTMPRVPPPLVAPIIPPLKNQGPSTPNSVSKIPLPPVPPVSNFPIPYPKTSEQIKIAVGRQNMPPTTSLPPPLIPQVSSQLPQGSQASRLNMSYEGSGYRLPPGGNGNYYGISVTANHLSRLGNAWQNNAPLQPGMAYQNSLIGRQQFNAQPYGYRPQANSISPVTNLQDRYDGGHMNLAQALQNLQNDTAYSSEFRK